MKAIKKQVEVECFRLGIDAMPQWFLNTPHTIERYFGTDDNIINEDDYIRDFDIVCEIDTLEGTMTACRGDYIIKGVEGEIYPCRADIFWQTYDIIGEDSKLTLDDKYHVLDGYGYNRIDNLIYYIQKLDESVTVDRVYNGSNKNLLKIKWDKDETTEDDIKYTAERIIKEVKNKITDDVTAQMIVNSRKKQYTLNLTWQDSVK